MVEHACPGPLEEGRGPVGRYELSLRMAHDLCICILVPADAADVVQPIPYAVVEIPARAVDADDVLARDQVDVRGGRPAVLVQDAARAGHFFVDVPLKNSPVIRRYRVLKRGAVAFRKVAVFALPDLVAQFAHAGEHDAGIIPQRAADVLVDAPHPAPHRKRRVFAVMLQNNLHPSLRDGAELAGYPFADSVFFSFHTLYL